MKDDVGIHTNMHLKNFPCAGSLCARKTSKLSIFSPMHGIVCTGRPRGSLRRHAHVETCEVRSPGCVVSSFALSAHVPMHCQGLFLDYELSGSVSGGEGSESPGILPAMTVVTGFRKETE